ncbi:MAG: hypothetical protein GF401_09660 [Chitinivibrionales bacterium]|nr:hypothetical protein [Chitinivibrionales bacterium]
MVSSPKTPENGFARREAELLAIAFNVMYNSANFYGAQHPTTQNNAADFFKQLKKTHTLLPVVTLSRQHDSLYIEQYCVDSKLKADRIIGAFKKVGIESISFEQGIAVKDIREFARIFDSNEQYDSIDAVETELAQRNVGGVRLNYITYRQVKADEDIVNRDETFLNDAPGVSKEDAFQNHSLEKLGKLFSLNELIEKPRDIAGDILSVVTDGTDKAQSQVVGRIRELNYQIQQRKEVAEQAVSIDEMMEAMCQLKMQLREGLELQRTMGKIVKTSAPVFEEVDQLTYEVIIRLVREEFRKGQISVSRLAQLIQRILPDINELKRLLPRLKHGLLEEGMSLPDFLLLAKELSKELQSESVIHAISESADEFGISTDEVVHAIKRDPKEAVKLILLGSEIKQGTGGTQEELSNLLSSYIENTSSKLALESHEAQGRAGGIQALEQIIHTIEKQLIARLRTEGVSEEVMHRVEDQLTTRFKKALSILKSNWIVDLVAKGEESATSYMMQIVDTIVDQEIEINSINNPLRDVLAHRGYTSAQINEFMTKIAERVKNRKTLRPLPKGVLNTQNLLYFLGREIKSWLRYQSPFSTLMVALRGVRYEMVWKELKNNEQAEIMPEIFASIRSLLRDLDLVGSIGTRSKEIPLIILPMTDESGAKIVRRRIATQLQKNSIPIDDKKAGIQTVISITSSQNVTGPDVMEYMKTVKERHRAAEEQARSA